MSASRRQSIWSPGYVAHALLSYLLPNAGTVVLDLLIIHATIGELWMVGFLCRRGVRRP